ncbi:hypothetical protein GCM10028807_48510 [Spirosoma daeguense]
MTLKNYQYLTEGVLEAYLLGLATESEKQEVEHLLATDNEVLAQLNEIELDMEEFFMRNAVPPPPAIREKLEIKLLETDIQKWVEPEESTKKSRTSQERESNYVNVEVDDTHIRVHKHWKAAFIAVFVLSKIFLIAGLYFYFKASSLEQEVTRLKTESQQVVQPNR